MNAPARVIPLRPPDTPALFNPQARVCADCGVRRFALFGALDLQGLDQIHVDIVETRLRPGQPLYEAGQPGVAAFTVRAGLVRLERTNAQGERRVLRLAGRSDLVGMESMLGQTYAADAIACTEVQACRLPHGLIESLTRREPALALDLMKRWQRALDDADEWLVELGSGSARQRMLRLLLKLSEYGEEGATLWLPSREQIGSMLGMTLETASRLVSALKREGVIETVDKRHVRVAMPRLLAALGSSAG
ncbi:MAG: Crp/Fnr family transcriptional regulator [Piscinibacter sp.]|nr:Crp/Fnr family transcriptional regulator [Piscinibacter sp.]